MELGELVLESNEFMLDGESFVQKKRTAIGSKMGNNYACTYMGMWIIDFFLRKILVATDLHYKVDIHQTSVFQRAYEFTGAE